MTHTMPSVEGLLQIYVLAEVKRKPCEVLLNPGCDFKGYDSPEIPVFSTYSKFVLIWCSNGSIFFDLRLEEILMMSLRTADGLSSEV